jgi:hypothetical protein
MLALVTWGMACGLLRKASPDAWGASRSAGDTPVANEPRASVLPAQLNRTQGAQSMVKHRLLCAWLVLSLLTPWTAAAQNPSYGIVTATMSPQHGAKVTELGAGYVRLDFQWFEIEPIAGQYNWGFLDAQVNEVESRGAKVFATLAYGPAWAAPHIHARPYNMENWKTFVKNVLLHFQGHDIVYGIWNEPNLHFLDDSDNAFVYGELFYYASQARNEVNSSIVLAGPETSHHAEGNSYYYRAMERIAPHMQPQDVVTVHWYRDGPYFPSYMDWIRSGARGHQIWLTETGEKWCDENYQAQRFDYMLNEFVGRGRTWWSKVFMYVLHSGGTNCESDIESIVRPDWSNRPAFDYYRDFIATHP